MPDVTPDVTNVANDTIDNINREIEALRYLVNNRGFSDAGTLTYSISAVIKKATKDGFKKFDNSNDKNAFYKVLAKRFHPDKLPTKNNARLNANLAPITIGEEIILLESLPQTILNAIIIEQRDPLFNLTSWLEDMYNYSWQLQVHIMTQYQRYPERWKDFITDFNTTFSVVLDKYILTVIYFVLPTALSQPFLFTIVLWFLFSYLFYAMQFIYFDPSEINDLKIIFDRIYTIQPLNIVSSLLYKKLTTSFPQDQNNWDFFLSMLLRGSQVISAPLFLVTTFVNLVLTNLIATLVIPVKTTILLTVALLINLPLYALNIFDYAKHCFDDVNPRPKASAIDPQTKTDSPVQEVKMFGMFSSTADEADDTQYAGSFSLD